MLKTRGWQRKRVEPESMYQEKGPSKGELLRSPGFCEENPSVGNVFKRLHTQERKKVGSVSKKRNETTREGRGWVPRVVWQKCRLEAFCSGKGVFKHAEAAAPAKKGEKWQIR